MKFDHLGVIVSDISIGRRHFSKIYDIKKWTIEYFDDINGVIVQFGKDDNDFCYELIAPINEASPVYNSLNKKNSILNHVAYLVDNIDQFFNDKLKGDFLVLGKPKKAIAYNMNLIQFFYSKEHNYIVELIQSSNHQHIFFDDL